MNAVSASQNDLSKSTALTVTELTDKIKGQLENQFSEVSVIGEVSNFKAHPSGHFYFSLKDQGATISAVMFRGANANLKFKIHDGLKVVVTGRVTVFPPRGNYQIVISRCEPEGLGALQLAFEQLKRKLEAEGLFETTRKRPLPRFPKAVGLVTSPSGAAVRDMLTILSRRFAGLEVLIFPVKVQGDGAGQEIAAAVRALNKFFPSLDVLIVGRGGGSIEDLWAFNEEVVARALFESTIPVISAVGHEIDFTIADFVADLRAPTPSAAAELVVSNKAEIYDKVDHLVSRLLRIQSKFEIVTMKVDDLLQKMIRSLEKKIHECWRHYQESRASLVHRSPVALLQQFRQRHDHAHQLLLRISKDSCQRRQWVLDALVQKLRLLDPKAIMGRGYSIVRLVDSDKLVKKASDIRMGDKLLIELAKGRITARVSS